ncbi:MAG: hypothetical protein Satyrvirus26_4 [Satyrvirus sp.]|uniref:ribose-phosphate diphosphokinase n=1 Tax=Satyrvirus sp. TaxID=2487771 RepID=A0A3G5AEG5_9VIRU|nr:MAG: hypothetical protein Satyrvirus26_4 [Satyrvirus sp.]
MANIHDLLDEINHLKEKINKSKNNDSVIIVMNSCGDLGDKIKSKLDNKIRSIDTKFFHFGNNEVNTFPAESIREKRVFIIGTGSNYGGSINDNCMAMFAMVRACRDASARDITLICGYYPYCRSDKKDQGRAPIMAKLIGDFAKVAGAGRLVTVDLHASQIQGFFDGPFDNLYAIDYLVNVIKKDYHIPDCVLVSPDAGGEKRVAAWATKLNIPYTFLTKSRNHNAISAINKHELVHKLDFKGKTAIIVDDIGDTLSTLKSASKILKENGVCKVVCAVTHGIFSGNAYEKLLDDDIDFMYVTNTLPQNQPEPPKIKIVDLSELFAEIILRCVDGKSLSSMFT